MGNSAFFRSNQQAANSVARRESPRATEPLTPEIRNKVQSVKSVNTELP